MTSGLCVVGIDAVVSNSEGAHKRNLKIQKVFKFSQRMINNNHDTTSTLTHKQSGPPTEVKQNFIPITKYIRVDNAKMLLAEVEQLSGGQFRASQVNF